MEAEGRGWPKMGPKTGAVHGAGWREGSGAGELAGNGEAETSSFHREGVLVRLEENAQLDGVTILQSMRTNQEMEKLLVWETGVEVRNCM